MLGWLTSWISFPISLYMDREIYNLIWITIYIHGALTLAIYIGLFCFLAAVRAKGRADTPLMIPVPLQSDAMKLHTPAVAKPILKKNPADVPNPSQNKIQTPNYQANENIIPEWSPNHTQDLRQIGEQAKNRSVRNG
ncbi:hypothetical protein N7468_004826 [Penicillium chermesinum]|uniref:Uncharacterized protein n=1 Tax=Penicillium chermesinum TaxID=63820 RepID=A0A9W9PC64_9EURO|nr:uncharacterized protein N7468_004826 [Penicillium chermesinum]KAJ5240207.1 hypothetical protein N7468_004826 [Penicillium chermesinum]